MRLGIVERCVVRAEVCNDGVGVTSSGSRGRYTAMSTDHGPSTSPSSLVSPVRRYGARLSVSIRLGRSRGVALRPSSSSAPTAMQGARHDVRAGHSTQEADDGDPPDTARRRASTHSLAIRLPPRRRSLPSPWSSPKRNERPSRTAAATFRFWPARARARPRSSRVASPTCSTRSDLIPSRRATSWRSRSPSAVPASSRRASFGACARPTGPCTASPRCSSAPSTRSAVGSCKTRCPSICATRSSTRRGSSCWCYASRRRRALPSRAPPTAASSWRPTTCVATSARSTCSVRPRSTTRSSVTCPSPTRSSGTARFYGASGSSTTRASSRPRSMCCVATSTPGSASRRACGTSSSTSIKTPTRCRKRSCARSPTSAPRSPS